ncbi:MAG: hypothetical protein MZV64_64105 [Ignavibacteriales bacterium]|nr:hypothetical protein [Ignavibacteriales bacterium]
MIATETAKTVLLILFGLCDPLDRRHRRQERHADDRPRPHRRGPRGPGALLRQPDQARDAVLHGRQGGALPGQGPGLHLRQAGELRRRARRPRPTSSTIPGRRSPWP